MGVPLNLLYNNNTVPTSNGGSTCSNIYFLSCLNNYYFNTGTQKSVCCHKQCFSCLDSSPTKCLGCINGRLQNFLCIPEDPRYQKLAYTLPYKFMYYNGSSIIQSFQGIAPNVVAFDIYFFKSDLTGI
jgi:hypothetical protein